MLGALVDTGFLVALFRRRDRLRSAAREHLQAHTYGLATVTPVIVETSFFLDPEVRRTCSNGSFEVGSQSWKLRWIPIETLKRRF